MNAMHDVCVCRKSTIACIERIENRMPHTLHALHALPTVCHARVYIQEATKQRHGMHALQMGWHELNTTLGEDLPSSVELVNSAKCVR